MSLKNQLTENVKLLQKAVIVRQESQVTEVLLLKRSVDAKSRPNCWDLPGGNSEWPEINQSSASNLHLKDLKREIFEETSINVAEEVLTLDKLVSFSTYFDNEKQVFAVICGWLVDYSSTSRNEIEISAEHQEYTWAKEADLINYDFGGAKGTFVLDMIKQAFARY